MSHEAAATLLRDPGHVPVLLDEIIHALDLSDNDIIVDGTFGGGGYSAAVLQSADVTLYGIDRDPTAAERGAAFTAAVGERFTLLQGCFGDMEALLADKGVTAVDAIVLDIGVSSFQIDQAERGFSFMKDGPLDMRMSRSGESAADVVNTYDEDDIANIIYKFGDEPKSRFIARAIVEAREEAPFTTTLQLAEVIRGAVHVSRKKGKKFTHPATKSFQALRIHVNDELGELDRALYAAERLLKTGGRLVVVSFHSLEDGLVKRFMIDRAGLKPSGSRHLPQHAEAGPPPTFALRKKSAIKPGDAEVERNPRARSSRLRVAIRTDADAGGNHET